MHTVLITAGPTRENLDPVRFLSNHSSGKMGIALAECFLLRGCKVILVIGPVESTVFTTTLRNGMETGQVIVHDVVSARDMLAACNLHFLETDIAVFAAAVADYRPQLEEKQKIKKSESEIFLRLVKNPDVASEFAKVKTSAQISVGFALETENMIAHGMQKLLNKNFDLIIMNTPNDQGSAFGHDTNKITIAQKDGTLSTFPLQSKKEAAAHIVEAVFKMIQQAG